MDAGIPTTAVERELDRLAERLQARFGEPDLVRRFVREAADHFDGARIQTYVPLFVERQVERRLRAALAQ